MKRPFLFKHLIGKFVHIKLLNDIIYKGRIVTVTEKSIILNTGESFNISLIKDVYLVPKDNNFIIEK